MKNFISFATLIALFMSIGTSCSDEPQNNEMKNIKLSRTEQEICTGNREFAFALYKQAYEAYNEQNFVLSPLSASIALSMLATGAEGNTYLELCNTLRYSEFSLDEINALNARLANELIKVDSKVNLQLANSIWIEDGSNVNPEFEKLLNKFYGTSLYTTNAPESQSNINNWVKEKTNNHISDFLKSPLSDDFGFALINSLYFKGEWKQQFNAKSTRNREFKNISGEIASIPTMHGTLNVSYCGTDKFTMCALSFGNGNYNFRIILPDEGYTLKDCMSELEETQYSGLLRMQDNSKLFVRLPKFSLLRDYDMIPILQNMGIRDAFSQDAKFRILLDEWKLLNKVQQTNYFEIDEQGAKASSTTIAVGGDTSVGPMEQFIVDRPFIFMLTEESTSTILFIGQITTL